MKTVKIKQKLTDISVYRFTELVFRSLLFLAAVVMYILNKLKTSRPLPDVLGNSPLVLMMIWFVFMFEMTLRFIPSSMESIGCQKQFARHYVPTEDRSPVPKTARTTFLVAASWVLLNGIIGVLYFAKVIDRGVLMLICLAYSVCDMVCILFFCPFQTWMMKNKCCVTCRIYNWDYAMMFTPLVFIPNVYSLTLLAMALALLVKWEITFHTHPERFFESKNACLSCENCKEKLCSHKTQLRQYLKKYRRLLRKQ